MLLPQVLEELGLQPVENVAVAGGTAVVDIALATASGQVAVLREGPKAYSRWVM